MPVWKPQEPIGVQGIEAQLEQALNPQARASSGDVSGMGYQNSAAHKTQRSSDESFGFGDILDMVNPLHHIPVVGHIYRNISGDQIKPVGYVVGGALYGGALGAAGGLINLVIQEETGKNIEDNAMSYVFDIQKPEIPSKSPVSELPGNLLSFVDMKAHEDIPPHNSGITITRG